MGAVTALAPIVGVNVDESPDVARPQFPNVQNWTILKTKRNKVYKNDFKKSSKNKKGEILPQKIKLNTKIQFIQPQGVAHWYP